METTKNHSRDIMDWLIGAAMLLCVLLQSIVLPVIFLIPVFLLWRKLSLINESITEKYKDKKITKVKQYLQKTGIALLGLLLAVIFVMFIYCYKQYLEIYWITYIREPLLILLQPVFNFILKIINTIFKIIMAILTPIITVITYIWSKICELFLRLYLLFKYYF